MGNLRVLKRIRLPRCPPLAMGFILMNDSASGKRPSAVFRSDVVEQCPHSGKGADPDKVDQFHQVCDRQLKSATDRG